MLAAAIRPYAPADLDAVVALVRELQVWEAQYFDRMTPPEEIGASYVERVLADCARLDGTILVAAADGSIVGYASVFSGADSADEGDEVFYRFAYVGDLVVAERARGTGIGRALLAECERRAREAGVRWLRIGVIASNQRALRLYREFGFRDGRVLLEKVLD